MRPAVVLGTLAAAWCSCALMLGCGASAPREADIYHDPALRPGVVRADGADATLLERLGEIENAEVVRVADQTFEVDRPYHAASGRWCRSVRGVRAEPRLACESDDGWVFVPQVLPTAPEPIPESPAEIEAEVPAEPAADAGAETEAAP